MGTYLFLLRIDLYGNIEYNQFYKIKGGENMVKEKHPSWFKMKLERRELIKQLSPETAVNVLLACWDFLETGEKPVCLSPIESVAFSAFMPDMKEAWERYIQRINAKASGNRTTSVDVE